MLFPVISMHPSDRILYCRLESQTCHGQWMVFLTVLEKDNTIQFAMHTPQGQEGETVAVLDQFY